MRSMTGFGKSEIRQGGKTLTVEVKTVNNRFLDINIKLPKILAPFEDLVRKEVQKIVSRGRVDIFLNFSDIGDDSKEVAVDTALAKSLIEISKTLEEDYSLPQDFTVSALMRTPDVITVKTKDSSEEELQKMLKEVCIDAFLKLDAMRYNEGEILKRDLSMRIKTISMYSDNLKVIAPMLLKEHREKLQNRIKEYLAGVEIDETRFINEVAFFADKSNIDEEITRLNAHIKQTSTVLVSDEPTGRKLDFMVQELNREANTICSKANNSEVTRIGVDLKCEIEKIREQVQNIE